MQAEQLIKEGRLDDALAALKDDVRDNPSSAEQRAFLYQLFCILGEWDKALTQINVLGDIAPKELLMVEYYRNAIRCEALRSGVFEGKRSPLMLGEPAEWVGLMVQAQAMVAQGKPAAAAELRDRAFEDAPAVAGTINGQPFGWIADTDHRLGPILEVIVQGKYYWTPMDNVRSVTIEPPGSLRDLIWARAEFVWANGGKAIGLFPVRYPGTTATGSDAAKLSRKTDFEDLEGDYCVGVGQRMWATDAGEFPILETTSITIGEQPEDGQQDGQQSGTAADG